MIPSRFEYFRPDSLQEALGLLTAYQDDAKILAGGQSLISLMKLRLANPGFLIDLQNLKDLSYIRPDPADAGRILIGAMTTYADIKASPALLEGCPLLPKAAAVVGDVQVRSRGTIGGSLAHADPAGDLPAAILALRADIKVVGPRGERWVPAEEFFLGMYATALAPDEILTEVRVPVLKGERTAYLKSARRPSDFAIVGVALCLRLGKDLTCDDIAIGMTGLTDKPYRAVAVEEKLRRTTLDSPAIAAAAPLIAEGMGEITGNIHASAPFRLELARVYLARAIRAAT